MSLPIYSSKPSKDLKPVQLFHSHTNCTLTPELAKGLEYSGILAEQLGDSYVGVEHLFLATLEHPGPAAEIMQRIGLDKNKVMNVIKEIREHQCE